MNKFKKIKEKLVNFSAVIAIGMLAAVFFVADKTAGTILMGIGIGIITFLIVLDEDFRRRF